MAAGKAITQGYVSTAEVLDDERVPDVDEKIRQLRLDDSQFTTMTTRAPTNQATREKVTWFEEEDFPRIIAPVGAVTNVAVQITLVAGQGLTVRPNDLLRNMRTNEALRISAVNTATDVIDVARGVGEKGGGTGIAMNAGDPILVINDAQPQGSDFPVARYMARVLGYNYTQIMRTTWQFTGTATAISLYGGREPAKEAVRKLREHNRKIEASGFFGPRGFASAVPPENEPQGMAGGLIEFITTNAKDINGVLTPDAFDNWLMSVMPFGTSEKVLFASPLVVAAMSKWTRTGMGTQFAAPDGGKTYGVAVDAFISGAYGYRIPVVVKKEWSEFPNTLSTPSVPKGYGSYAFLVDMSYVERRPLRDRDTRLLTEQQPKGKDSYAAEYITEMTWQIAVEKAHGYIFGVTGGSNP